MGIGLIGLGRIGAFHAGTLSALPSVTSLVVTDAVPAAIQSVVGKYGVEAADTPEKLLASGVDGVVVAAATDAHPELIIAAAVAAVPVAVAELHRVNRAALRRGLRPRRIDHGAALGVGGPARGRHVTPAHRRGRGRSSRGSPGGSRAHRAATLAPIS